MLHLFLITLAFTIVLFIGAALVFNYSKQRSARSKQATGSSCQHNGGTIGCACTSALQTTLRKL